LRKKAKKKEMNGIGDTKEEKKKDLNEVVKNKVG
jgi:hypothetical protein